MYRMFLCLLALLFSAVTGWGQNELWRPVSYDGGGSTGDRGPVICDVDHDGHLEIIAVSRINGSTDPNGILVYDAQNPSQVKYTLLIPQVYLDSGYVLNATPAVADGNGDGVVEIAIGIYRSHEYVFPSEVCPIAEGQFGFHKHDSTCTTCTHYFSHVVSWAITVPQPSQSVSSMFYGILRTPVVGDVNGDGLDDLVFEGAAFEGHSVTDLPPPFHCSDYWENVVCYFSLVNGIWVSQASAWEGVSSQGIQFGEPQFTLQYAMPALGDVTGDGIADIVALFPLPVDGHIKLNVYDVTQGMGTPWQTMSLTGLYTLNRISATELAPDLPGPLLADMDGDGQLEAVFAALTDPSGSGAPKIVVADLVQGAIPQTLPVLPTYFGNPSLMTGRSEMAIANGPSGTHYAPYTHNYRDVYIPGDWTGNNTTPQTKGYWMKRNFTYGYYEVQSAWDGDFHWPKGPISDADISMSYVPIIANTDVLPDFECELQTGVTSGAVRHWKLDNLLGADPTPWTIAGAFSPDRIQNSMTVADLNGDGQAELVVTAHQSATGAQIHAYELENVTYDPQVIEWNGYRNGPKHKGLYAQPVTGEQALSKMIWEGRVTVSGMYYVPEGHTLIIKPGTVVEFRSGASLFVDGVLSAIGQGTDSVFFKPEGTDTWSGITFHGQSVDTLEKCVVHGGTSVTVDHCFSYISQSHIYNMETGLDVFRAKGVYVLCDSNLIEGCSLYGIRGTSSAGTFTHNTVRNCTRAGIEWVGDRDENVESPFFYFNMISNNGVPNSSPIAGGYFNSTTARLECNTFQNNCPYQIFCENQGNVVMNSDYGGQGTNWLVRTDVSGMVWCGVDLRTCTWTVPPTGFDPLLRLVTSEPLLAYGANGFHFDQGQDGVYIWSDRCTPQLTIKENHFEPDNSPPGAGNHHFCPETEFYCPNPLEFSLSCAELLSLELQGASAAYQVAANQERVSNFSTASASFAGVIAQYPESEEASWATRGTLRTGLAANQLSSSLHDSLYAIWSDEAMPIDVRHSARREAVWALIAGQNWFAARSELQAVIADPVTTDSLWAVVTTDMVSLLEDGGAHTGSVPRDMRQRLASFHDRLNRLMGRPTDQEVLNSKPAVVKSEKMCRAYPNPFNNTVNIAFDLRKDTYVRLDVFNLLGQKVATLVNEPIKAGSHTYSWSGKNASSGMYFYRFQAGGHVETQKLMLLK